MADTATNSPADPEPVDIALGFDSSYVPHAAVAIRSIVTSAPGARLRFILLTEGLANSHRSSLEALAPAARFHWIDVQRADFPAIANREHFSPAILYRLGLETLAPADCHRVVYLDSDIVVRHDIRELCSIDLKQNPVGAVADCDFDSVGFAKSWGLPAAAGAYFNSGVLLIDLDDVRREKLFSKAARFIVENGATLRYADQDALNYVFWSRWHAIARFWNVQRVEVIWANARSRREGRALLASTGIIHFTGDAKPWLPGSYHPWAWTYWAQLLRTPYALQVKRRYAMSSAELARIFARWVRCIISPGSPVGRDVEPANGLLPPHSN